MIKHGANSSLYFRAILLMERETCMNESSCQALFLRNFLLIDKESTATKKL